METLKNKGYKISEPIADNVLQEARRDAGQMASAAIGMPEYKSAADFDARFSEMLRADEEKERARKEKEIQRKQIAQSMSDLGAVFGDVIKASGGALVTPRDVQAKYDALDKQTQSVYDNYRARMDAMRKGLQDNAAKDRDRALKAKTDAEALANQWKLYALKKADEDAKIAAERKWKTDEAEKDRDAKKNAAYIRANRSNGNSNYYQLSFPNNRVVTLTKADALNRIRDTFSWMVQKGMIDINDDARYPHEEVSGFRKNEKGEDVYVKENIPIDPVDLSTNQMFNIISDYMPYLSDSQSDELYAKLSQRKVAQESVGKTNGATQAKTTTQQSEQTSTGGLY